MSAGRPWVDSEPVSAQSPTAFLELLSSAATSRAPPASSGLKDGVTGTAMMNGATGTAFADQSGLTPMFTYAAELQTDPRPNMPQRVSDEPHESSRTSTGSSMPSMPSMNSASTSSTTGFGGIPPLTPSAVFNFSPMPMNDTTTHAYVPQFDDQGRLKPSGKADGAWRDIETADNTEAIPGVNISAAQATIHDMAGEAWQGPDTADNFRTAPSADVGGGARARVPNQHTDPAVHLSETFGVNMPPQMDEAAQQQLLMDLFWPGWPPSLPEPHVVNDL